MAPVRTIEEIDSRQAEIRTRLQEIDREYAGQALPDDVRSEWNDLNEELEHNDELRGELVARLERIAQIVGDPERTERPAPPTRGNGSGRRNRRIPDNIWALEEYRKHAQSVEQLPDLYRDGAREALERAAFPHPAAKREDVQEHIEKLLDKDAETGALAERMLLTGSNVYKRAFGKAIAGVGLTAEEERALSLTTTAGGFAVPYELDPTIIPTSNGAVNPLRAISRVETITTNEWRGVSSAGITAGYAAEAAEASDNAPTLAQPTATPERAHAFIPFSYEIGQDWGSLQAEMARLLQDAKDELEANKFFHGSGSDEPEGLLVGGTAVVATAAATTLAVGDLYSLEEALPPRFRPRARIVANRKQFNRVRQFDTSGGAALWVRLGDGLPPELIGYPSHEASEMTSALTQNSSIITIGDFSHFLIVDRVGMSVELMPHLLGSNRRPTGQRGLYAFWRNTTDVLAWQAFRTLKVA